MFIYVITNNVNGKKYVGKTDRSLPKRREARAAIARRSAAKRIALKDYTCPDCLRSFVQVLPGVYGGHRKNCSKGG